MSAVGVVEARSDRLYSVNTMGLDASMRGFVGKTVANGVMNADALEHILYHSICTRSW